jgi:hypothetical protein
MRLGVVSEGFVQAVVAGAIIRRQGPWRTLEAVEFATPRLGRLIQP